MKRSNSLLIGLGTAAALLMTPVMTSGCKTTSSADKKVEESCCGQGKCGKECSKRKKKGEGSCGEGSCGEGSCGSK